MDRWSLYYYYMLLFKCLHSKMVIIIFNSSPRLTVINQLGFKTKEFFYVVVRAHCIKAFVHTSPHNGMITLKYNRFTTTTFVGWDFPNPYKIYSDLHIIYKRIIDCCTRDAIKWPIVHIIWISVKMFEWIYSYNITIVG